MYTLHTRFCTFGTDLYAQSVLSNKISASELSRKFIKSALLVGSLPPQKKKPSTAKNGTPAKYMWGLLEAKKVEIIHAQKEEKESIPM